MEIWQHLGLTDMKEVPVLAIHAEELGFTGVAFSDHLATFSDENKTDRVWYSQVQWPDPFVMIASLSSVTKSLKFLTAVFALPLRDPLTVAKSLATAELVTGGRLEFGVGAGAYEAEFEIMGKSFHDRGRRMDEMISVVRYLAKGGAVDYKGKFYEISRAVVSPGYTKEIPIYVGGDTKNAIKRAAKNDGWIGYEYEIEDLIHIIRILNDERIELKADARKNFKIIASIKDLSEKKYNLAMKNGMTGILKNSWTDLDGKPSGLTLTEKQREMELFAKSYICRY